MAGRYAFIFLCTILLKQATGAAIREENKVDFNTFYNTIYLLFYEIYTATVLTSVDVFRRTIKDMESFSYNNPDILSDKNPEFIYRMAKMTNYIKEVESAEKPLKLSKQHSLILRWETLFRLMEAKVDVNLLFTLSLEKNGFQEVYWYRVSKKYKLLYVEFNTKLSEFWHTLTKAQKADNVQFSEWYNEYKKLPKGRKFHNFDKWGKLFTILENNNNEHN